MKHSYVKPVNCYLRKMPCSWTNREAHKTRTKTQAKPSQTNHLFRVTILAGMRRGGQNPFSTFTKKTCFLLPASRHTHFYTVPRTAGQILQQRYSAMLATEQRQLNTVSSMLGQTGSHMSFQLTSLIKKEDRRRNDMNHTLSYL